MHAEPINNAVIVLGEHGQPCVTSLRVGRTEEGAETSENTSSVPSSFSQAPPHPAQRVCPGHPETVVAEEQVGGGTALPLSQARPPGRDAAARLLPPGPPGWASPESRLQSPRGGDESLGLKIKRVKS